MAVRGTRRLARRLAPRGGAVGLTLIELIVAFTLMLILSMMALPVAQVKVRREQERRLRDALYDMRKAIDRYKDLADAGKLGQLDPDNHGYPETLEGLVEGVEIEEGMGGMGGQGGFGSPLSQSSGMNQQRGGFGSNSGGFGSNSGMGGGGSGFGGNRGGASGSRSSAFGNSSGSGFNDPLDSEDAPKKVRFLRKIPIDPITGSADWGMRSNSDDPGSMSWGGRNVFDVFSLSYDMALDGTRYNEW